MANIIRHGDVMLVEVEKVPNSAKLVTKANEFVVAEGETTGHRHVIVIDRPQVKLSETFIKAWQDAETRYLEVTAPAIIKHEEHKTITIAPGTYKQIQEREKDWFSMVVKKVVD